MINCQILKHMGVHMNKKLLILLISLPVLSGCWNPFRRKTCTTRTMSAPVVVTDPCCNNNPTYTYSEAYPEYIYESQATGYERPEAKYITQENPGYEAYQDDEYYDQNYDQNYNEYYDQDYNEYQEGVEFEGDTANCDEYYDNQNYDYDQEQIPEEDYIQGQVRTIGDYISQDYQDEDQNYEDEEYLSSDEQESEDYEYTDTSGEEDDFLLDQENLDNDEDDLEDNTDYQDEDDLQDNQESKGIIEESIDLLQENPEFDNEPESDIKEGFKEVLFDFDGKKIKTDQEDILRSNLGKIRQLALAGHKIVVEGHSFNPEESKDDNLKISRKKAESVANYLIENGLDKDAIQILAQGDEMPLNIDQEEFQGLNRRVEIYSYKEA